MSQFSSLSSGPPRKRHRYEEDHGMMQFPHDNEEDADQQDQNNAVSTLISSFHHQLGLLLECLGNNNENDFSQEEDPSSLAVVMGGRALQHDGRRRPLGHRQCLRTIQQLLSQEDELECLWSGVFVSPPVVMQESNECDQSALRRREELLLFMDDLLTLVCLEKTNCEDPSAASLLNSIVVETANTILPNLTQVHSLSEDQISTLAKRVFSLLPEVVNESMYLSSEEMNSKLSLLEGMVNLLNDQITPEILREIVLPSEAITVLLFPLDLLCCASNGGGDGAASPLTPSPGQPRIYLPESLSHSLQMFLNILLQNVSQWIAREQEQKGQHTAVTSIREWLELRRTSKKNATGRARGTDSQDTYSTATLSETTRAPEASNALVTLGENEGLSTAGASSVGQILRMLDQHGGALMEETTRKLQEFGSRDLDANTYVEINVSDYDSEAPTPLNPTVKELSDVEKIEEITGMVFLATEFLFLMDSEEAIAANPTATRALESLWTQFANFVLQTLSDGVAYQEHDKLQDAATEILFRLTKHYVGILFRSDAVSTEQSPNSVTTHGTPIDETCGLITTIFRLMQGTNQERWNREGQEWVAYLLQKHPNQTDLQHALYAALLTLVSCPEEDQMQADTESNYFAILGLTGLDDADATGRNQDDPWGCYMRDVLFPSLPT